MPFVLKKDECPCCEAQVHHCKACWNKYHNGERDNDYIEPDYYGMPLGGDEGEQIHRNICKLFGLEYKQTYKPNKKRKYKEGDYKHE